MHQLNPHALNSLLCLGGIAFAIGLMIYGHWLDHRQDRLEEAAARRARQASPQPMPLALDDQRQACSSYRQVA